MLVILIGITSLLLFSPQVSRAEIATTWDWVGLFATGAGNRKSDTVNGNTWGYPSNKDASNICAQTPGTTPKLSDSDGCAFTPNPTPPPGNYEVRLYANDYNPDNGLDASGLIAQSALASPTPSPSAGIVCPAQIPYPRVSGLISAPKVSSKFGNPTGQCVIGNQASFAPFKIPDYNDLKSIYFDQSKSAKTTPTCNGSPPCSLTQTDLNSLFNQQDTQKLIYINGSLTIEAAGWANTLYPDMPVVIFISGGLTINGNVTYGGTQAGGVVFVVGGNVDIAPAVTLIDGVIISDGVIYTAGSGCSNSSPVTASQLVINGSLISLQSTNNVKFCRTLASGNDTTPAELMNQQPKYLTILRDLYSDTLQKWSEIQ